MAVAKSFISAFSKRTITEVIYLDLACRDRRGKVRRTALLLEAFTGFADDGYSFALSFYLTTANFSSVS